MMNPKVRARTIMNHMIRITHSDVRGAHDAQMVITQGKAYVVYIANNIQPGEDSVWPFVYCAMSIVDIITNQVLAVHTIAEGAQIFSNVQLKPGACFVPRVYQKDERTLRVFFTSMEPQKRETESWYRDFDIVSGTFDNAIYPLYLETDEGRTMLTPTLFHAGAKKLGFSRALKQDGPYLFDADKQIDGKRYAALNIYHGKLNALGVMNEEMDTIRILSYIINPLCEELSEAAVEKLPDGRWIAILRNDSSTQNYRFATSTDGMKWSDAEEWPVVQNGSNSKPLLYRYGNLYCLGWQEKPDRSRFNIDISKDFVHWKRFISFDDADFSLQYPSLCVWENDVYICCTHGVKGTPKESIYFGRLCSLKEMEVEAE